MQMPMICARCGQCEGTATWDLKGRYVTVDWNQVASNVISRAFRGWGSEGVVSRAVESEAYCLPVPVCEDCLRPLRTHRLITISLVVAGLVGGGLWLGVRAYRADLNNGNYFGLLSWSVGGFLGCLGGYCAGRLGAWTIGSCAGNQLASFNGLHYHFRNPEFHRRFAILNPAWVKP